MRAFFMIALGSAAALSVAPQRARLRLRASTLHSSRTTRRASSIIAVGAAMACALP